MGGMQSWAFWISATDGGVKKSWGMKENVEGAELSQGVRRYVTVCLEISTPVLPPTFMSVG